jgi:hypothetical protein
MRLYARKRDALTGEWNPPPVLKTEAAPDGAAHHLKKLQIFFLDKIMRRTYRKTMRDTLKRTWSRASRTFHA